MKYNKRNETLQKNDILYILKEGLLMNLNQEPNNTNNSNNFDVDSNQGINTNQQYSNSNTIFDYTKLTNISNNTTNDHDSNLFSKKCKILMILTLIGALVIFLDKFITSMDWYWNLMVSTIFTRDDQLKQVLEALNNLIYVFNWVIVLIITIVSIIFLLKDKKQNKNISIYEWYIFAGLLHIFVGTVGFTSLLYSVPTLIISIKNKNAFINESSKKVNKFYMFFSLIITTIILILFIGTM